MKQASIGFFLLCCSLAFSTIWTVDNNIPSVGQFQTIQAAHDAAASGDIIHVLPSGSVYTGVNITKNVTITGTGWIPQNYDGNLIKATKIDGIICLLEGSEGSIIEGLGGQFSAEIYDHQVSIKRCYLWRLKINSGCHNVLISNNVISSNKSSVWSSYRFFGTGDARNCGIWLMQDVQCSFLNNIIFMDYQGEFSNYNYLFSYLSSNIHLINNVFHKVAGITFCYDYTDDGAGYQTGLICVNNLFAGGDTNFCPSGDAFQYNLWNNNSTVLYGSNFHLTISSAAIDAGNPDPMFNDLNGTRNDCGAYGGPTPFVDGGVPGWPSIYQISGDYIVGQDEDWQLEIKAKTNRD